MPRPPYVFASTDDIAALYREAWQYVKAEEARVISDPRLWRQQRRLHEIEQGIQARMDGLVAPTREWVEGQLPVIYQAGAQATSPGWAWAAPAPEVVGQMATTLFSDLLTATRGVSESAKRLIRQAVREATNASVTAGDTAVQAAADAAAGLEADFGIYAVEYANGALVSLDGYAEMAVRTTTAIAYNRGALTTGEQVEWWEVFDGTGCGWVEHDDPDEADGTIRTRDDCLAYEIAHPNCRRSFGPREDLNGYDAAAIEDAGVAGGEVTDGEASQAAQDAAGAILSSRGEIAQQRVLSGRERTLGARAERLAARNPA